MSNTTVEQFAAELKKPVEDLLKQLASAGVNKSSGSDSITSDDKQQLLAYLKKSHGSDSGTISISRKKAEVSTVGGVQVETRRRSRKVVIPSSDDLTAEAKAKAEQAAQEKQAAEAAAQAEREAAERAEAEKAAAEAQAQAEAVRLQAEQEAQAAQQAQQTEQEEKPVQTAETEAAAEE
uniref:translation initiation factor IF-2 N-terminal domain-containing protein n=1 Tax=Neisseria dentiae TaxID=194197 RepID=UPI0035A1726C